MNAATDPPDDPSFAENPSPAGLRSFPFEVVEGLHDALERAEAVVDLLALTDMPESSWMLRQGTVAVASSIILEETGKMRELLHSHRLPVELEIEEP